MKLLLMTILVCFGIGCQTNKEIFDGKSMTGWRELKFPQSHPYSGGKWEIENGALCGSQFAGSMKGSLLISEEKFSDFELTLQFNHDWGCDSGVFLRANESGAGIQISVDYIQDGIVGFVHGQGIGNFNTSPFKLKYDGKENFSAEDSYDSVKRDKITYACTSQEFIKALKPGQWNTLKIRCEGQYPLITTWLNGTKVMILDSNVYRGRYRKDPNQMTFDKDNVNKTLGIEGHIGLQCHPGKRMNGKVRYRAIKIRRL